MTHDIYEFALLFIVMNLILTIKLASKLSIYTAF